MNAFHQLGFYEISMISSGSYRVQRELGPGYDESGDFYRLQNLEKSAQYQ